MKDEDLITESQDAVIDRLFDYDHTLLLASMGAGKTVCVLTAAQLLLDRGVINRLLIVAPLKVCREVWATESAGWSHLQGQHIDLAIGPAAKRVNAIHKKGKIVVINFENLLWASNLGLLEGFDGLVVDESTRAKGYGETMKALRFKLKQFKWRVAMTGTIMSENIQQIFYQMMLVDRGKSLGTDRDNFMRHFFYPTDFAQRNWAALPGSVEAIAGLVYDYVYMMPDYRGELPELNIVDLPVEIGKTGRHQYSEMIDTFQSAGVMADTSAAKVLKLEQLANGFIYDESGETIRIHHAKSEVLNSELGKLAVTLIIVYQFDADLATLREMYPEGMCLNDSPDVVTMWNSGELPVLFLHPKSGGHGLNLYKGGYSMVWYSPVWSRDQWSQTVARIWRRGQSHAVTVWRLVATGTVDQVKIDRVEGKGAFQPLFMAHIKAVKASPL